jgi:hypothetical protein
MSIEATPSAPPGAPREAAPARLAKDPAPTRPRQAFADRLAEEPPALLAGWLARPGPGPLREAVGPVAAPRAPAPIAPPTLESQGVLSLRVRTVDGAGEVALRVRHGSGVVEVHLRETPRAGVEICLTGTVPEADLDRLSALLARRLGPEVRVAVDGAPARQPADEDPRDRKQREASAELEEADAGPRRRSRRRGFGAGGGVRSA